MFSSSVTRRLLGSTALLQHVLFGLTVVLWAKPSVAQERSSAVELHALDGSAVVKGDLVEVSDGSYVLDTALGTIRIGLEEVNCIGEGCPRLDRFDADFAIDTQTDDLKALVLSLLTDYADNLGADYQLAEVGDVDSEIDILDTQTGERLSGVDVRSSEAAGADAGSAGPNDLRVFGEQDLVNIAGNDDELLLGLDGVAVIVHPQNPISALSRRAIGQLFACLESGASILVGADGPVRLYAPDDRSSTFRTFKTTVLDRQGVELCGDVEQLGSDAEIAAAVAGDPNAIGFVDLAYESDAKTVAINECGLEHEPSFFNAKTGDYPLARRILMNAPPLEASSGALQRFIDFALSDGIQGKLEDNGLVGLTLESTSGYALTYRLARLQAAMSAAQDQELVSKLLEQTENATRLSATFRFSSNASSTGERHGLDNRSQRDLTRLARYIRANADRDSELLLFGFADASGDYETNLTLSQQRAQSIADKLTALGIPVALVAGYGEEAPIACNEEPAGRAQNRRVEVWMRS